MLAEIKNHRVIIVGHKQAPRHVEDRFTVIDLPNIGLEFGAYDDFIKRFDPCDTLFMHDDASVNDPEIFSRISACGHDQAFVFRDEADGRANQNFHGRMWFASARFIENILSTECNCHQAVDRVDYHNNHFCNLSCAESNQKINAWTNDVKECTYRRDQGHKRCRQCGTVIVEDKFVGTVLRGQGPHTGIWFDRENAGHSGGCPPVGVRHYNDAIYHLAIQCSRMASEKKFDAKRVLYCPEVNLHRRGVPK